MTEMSPIVAQSGTEGHAIFTPDARRTFAASYPEKPHKLTHLLADHPLLSIEALAHLGESLPQSSTEFSRGDVGVGTRHPGKTGLSIGETIRNVQTSGSWVVLKRIEQIPAYADLLASLLAELEDAIVARTGKMLRTEGFIFISSPGAVTPFHFDPEHNILLQLVGNKAMTMFPAGDARIVPDRTHEVFHRGGGRELDWDDSFETDGTVWRLEPGEALYVPVMAPHYVRNGPAPSISLSITWRSEWSFAEADARALNGLLRQFGLRPRAPGRWPDTNRAKSLAWRALRRAGVR